jgi:CMP/dCMP kinase
MGLEKLDIVAIDGPAGSGKSTVAKGVAERLGYSFLDTGAMYRAVAYGALSRGIPVEETCVLQGFLNRLDLTIRHEKDGMRLFLDGMDVTDGIRKKEMGQYASDYSKLPSVREYCSRLQRQFGQSGRIVCEGRDMGTVVFPDARWKFFLTASLEERAFRRWKELKDKGETITRDDIENSLKKRDYQDTNRDLAPLKPADDAVIIDTTDMTIEDVILKIVEVVDGSRDKKA